MNRVRTRDGWHRSEFLWREITENSTRLEENALPNGKSCWRNMKAIYTLALHLPRKLYSYFDMNNNRVHLDNPWGNTTLRLLRNNKLTTYITCHQNIKTMHDIHPALARLPEVSVNLTTVPSARFPGSQAPRLVPSFPGRERQRRFHTRAAHGATSLTAVRCDRMQPTKFQKLDFRAVIIRHDIYAVKWN